MFDAKKQEEELQEEMTKWRKIRDIKVEPKTLKQILFNCGMDKACDICPHKNNSFCKQHIMRDALDLIQKLENKEKT